MRLPIPWIAVAGIDVGEAAVARSAVRRQSTRAYRRPGSSRTTLARRSVPEELVKLLRSNTLELMLIAPMLNIAALVTRVSVKRGTE